MKWKRVIAVLALVLRPILNAMTPKIEETLEKYLLKLFREAEESDNPLDDLLLGFLLDIMDIPRP